MRRNFFGIFAGLCFAVVLICSQDAAAIDLFDGKLVIHGKVTESYLRRGHETQDFELYDYETINARTSLKLETMWHAYKGPEYELNVYGVFKEFYDAGADIDGDTGRYLDWGGGGHARKEYRSYNSAKDIIRESYVELNHNLYQIRLGKQIISWGETSFERMVDNINPVDARGNLNPAYPDYSEIKRGLWMGRFFYTPRNLPMDMNFELLLIPDFEPTRQWPTGYHLLHPSSFNSFKNSNDQFRAYYRDQPDDHFNKLEVGFRVRGFLKGIDWTASYFHHRADDGILRTGMAIASVWPGLTGKGHAKNVYHYGWQDSFGVTLNKPVDVRIPIIPGTDLAMTGNMLRFEGLYEHDKAGTEFLGANVRVNKYDRYAVCLRWDTKIFIPGLTPWARNKYLSSGTQLFYEIVPDKRSSWYIYPWVTYGKKHKHWTVLTEELSYELWNGRILPGLYAAYYTDQGGGYVAPALGFKPTFKWTFMLRYLNYFGLYKEVNKKDFWTLEVVYEF
ncbi:MAG: DUF1302 family protein [Pseudomonadota bacterium]